MPIDWEYLFTGERRSKSTGESKVLKAVEANTSALGLMYWMTVAVGYLGMWAVTGAVRSVGRRRHRALVGRRARRIR